MATILVSAYLEYIYVNFLVIIEVENNLIKKFQMP